MEAEVLAGVCIVVVRALTYIICSCRCLRSKFESATLSAPVAGVSNTRKSKVLRPADW